MIIFYFLFFLLICSKSLLSQKIPNFIVSNNELLEMSRKLESVDTNRAKNHQIGINYQKYTTTRDDTDNAPQKLFSKVDSALLRKPSYELFIKMMDNFNKNTGIIEPFVSNEEEKREVGAFLDYILETKPMKELYEWFKKKGHPIGTNPSVFRYWIGQLWFSHYSRALGKPDTSGFEHVFIGEIKNNEISGMHNWVRFHILERNSSQNFDYKGFVVKRFVKFWFFLLTLSDSIQTNREKIQNVMAAVKFSWDKIMKRSGTFLIGTSPEFDMALYTMCFLSRRGRDTCDVELNGCPLSITSYEIYQKNKVYIGSIFPSAGRITDQCRQQNDGRNQRKKSNF